MTLKAMPSIINGSGTVLTAKASPSSAIAPAASASVLRRSMRSITSAPTRTPTEGPNIETPR